MKRTLFFNLSEQFAKAEYISSGSYPSQIGSLDFDDSSLSPDQREMLCERCGDLCQSPWEYPIPSFDHVPPLDELLDACSAQRAVHLAAEVNSAQAAATYEQEIRKDPGLAIEMNHSETEWRYTAKYSEVQGIPELLQCTIRETRDERNRILAAQAEAVIALIERKNAEALSRLEEWTSANGPTWLCNAIENGLCWAPAARVLYAEKFVSSLGLKWRPISRHEFTSSLDQIAEVYVMEFTRVKSLLAMKSIPSRLELCTTFCSESPGPSFFAALKLTFMTPDSEEVTLVARI